MSGECNKCGEHALECKCGIGCDAPRSAIKKYSLTSVETISIPEICECGRLYKDRISHLGKMMCSACYTDLSVEELKKLWGTPFQDTIKNILNNGTPPSGNEPIKGIK